MAENYSLSFVLVSLLIMYLTTILSPISARIVLPGPGCPRCLCCEIDPVFPDTPAAIQARPIDPIDRPIDPTVPVRPVIPSPWRGPPPPPPRRPPPPPTPRIRPCCRCCYYYPFDRQPLPVQTPVSEP